MGVLFKTEELSGSGLLATYLHLERMLLLYCCIAVCYYSYPTINFCPLNASGGRGAVIVICTLREKKTTRKTQGPLLDS